MAVKIMVVDDSTTMRKIVEMTFAAENAEVLAVDGGPAALSKLDSFAPDLVFADLSMNPDGYELAKELKARRPSAAVVALSSQQHPYDAAKGGAAGIDDHVVKPFDTQTVIDRVAQVLGRPRTSAGAAPAAAPAPKPAAPAPAPAAAMPLAAGPRDMKRTMAFGMPLAPVANPVGPVQGATGHAPANPTATAIPPIGAPPVVPRPAAVTAPQGAPVPVATPSPAPTVPKPASAPAAPRPVTQQGHAPVAAQPAPAPKPAPAPVAAQAAAPAPKPSAAPAPAPVVAPVAAAATAVVSAGLESKLAGLGLTKDQIAGVLALSREVVEQVVWEVVPELAETLIKEEIKRLTSS